MFTLWTQLVSIGAVIQAANGLNSCFDPANEEYRCAAGTESLRFWAPPCNLADEDYADLLECFDTAGRETITRIDLSFTEFTSFPLDLFVGLPALERIELSSSKITAYEAGLFDDVADTLTRVSVWSNDILTSLPADLFRGLEKVTYLGLTVNRVLETLPVGLFADLRSVTTLNLHANGLISLPLGIFDGLTTVDTLPLQYNEFTTFPADIFAPLTSLQNMWFHGVTTMQCLPDSTAVNVRLYSETVRDGTCECVPDIAVCEEGLVCIPGTQGYTCGAEAPTPVTTVTPSPVASPTAVTTTSSYDDDFMDDFTDDDSSA